MTASPRDFYFFIGTEAELIKVFPVFVEFEKRNISYKIIASGQNDITKNELFSLLKKKEPDIFLSRRQITQTTAGLLTWFVKTLFSSQKILAKEFITRKKHTTLIIHGDTISTVMGALLGRRFGLSIAHIEAGLRSHNYLHPFPEEIDRVIASRFVSLHLCPNEWAVTNLKTLKGRKINTRHNTLLESLSIVLPLKRKVSVLEKVGKEKYFVFVLHRQENLYNKKLVANLIKEVTHAAKKKKCIFVLHKPTERVLHELGMLKELKENNNIILTERLGYISFMKVLQHAEFLVTDGGSNQEESYYFGKPSLILRSVTERTEGLGENVVLSKNNTAVIHEFMTQYTEYKRKPVSMDERPAKIIVDSLFS